MTHSTSTSRAAAFGGKIHNAKRAGQPTLAGSRIYAYINMAFSDVEVGDIILSKRRPWAVAAKRANRVECAAVTKFGVHGLRILNHEPWKASNEYGPHCPVNAFMCVMHRDAYRFQDQPDEVARSRWSGFITTDDFCELEELAGLNFSTDLHRESVINFVNVKTLKRNTFYDDHVSVIGRFTKPKALLNIMEFKRQNPQLFKKARRMCFNQRNEATGVQYDLQNPEERRYLGNQRVPSYVPLGSKNSGSGIGFGEENNVKDAKDSLLALPPPFFIRKIV